MRLCFRGLLADCSHTRKIDDKRAVMDFFLEDGSKHEDKQVSIKPAWFLSMDQDGKERQLSTDSEDTLLRSSQLLASESRI